MNCGVERGSGMNIEALKEFSYPYYRDKDIMHNMWHIELTERWVKRILDLGGYEVDEECLTYALYFHGFIWSDEAEIVRWLAGQGVEQERIERIVKIAWESQRSEIPETMEGKILHDAHVLEGGKTYLVVKTLITGSVRGQSLTDTIEYMKNNVLDKNRCYLPETAALCAEMNEYARRFVEELEAGITP